jgi:hypothetical protein
MANKVVLATLNKTYNEIADILETNGVEMFAGPTGTGPILAKKGLALLWHEGKREHKNDLPPASYYDFIACQGHVDKAKGHDYDKSFMTGLINHGKVIWAWEVTKKLQRIRTWINRGTLLVSGEGVVNAVGDLFNYTIMYLEYKEATEQEADPLEADNPDNFARIAASVRPWEIAALLIDNNLIKLEETRLCEVLIEYMGGSL